MFSPLTQHYLNQLMGTEAGQSHWVTLPPEVYRELAFKARQWEAMQAAPCGTGATIRLVPMADGSLRIEP